MNKDDFIQYLVFSVKKLQVIRKHFEDYPLHTRKRADFELWIKAFELIQNKEHLTAPGIQKIVAIKASLNLGIPDELKAAFPTIVPVERPNVENIINPDPHWLAGFTSAEGSFFIHIYKANTKLGVAVKLIFKLDQHVRDEQLFKDLVKYLGCGKIYFDREVVVYWVTKYSDILEKIIPFFKKYPIIGVKALDFNDFSQVAELMKDNKHLTQQGLDQIRKIKTSMNQGRKSFDLQASH